METGRPWTTYCKGNGDGGGSVPGGYGSGLSGEGERRLIAHAQNACRTRVPVDHTAKVVAKGIQRVGFELGINMAQFLFQPVDRMKETAAVHVELPAAKIVVRTQQEMVAENAILLRRQRPLRNPQKIRQVLLPLAREDAASDGAVAGLPGDRRGALAQGQAFLEARQTRTKNPAKHTIARNLAIFAIPNHAQTFAGRTSCIGNSDSCRSIPQHFQGLLLAHSTEPDGRGSELLISI